MRKIIFYLSSLFLVSFCKLKKKLDRQKEKQAEQIKKDLATIELAAEIADTRKKRKAAKKKAITTAVAAANIDEEESDLANKINDKFSLRVDKKLTPENFKEKLDEILKYLRETNNQWNMFSGLIANLNHNTMIERIDEYNDKEFIYINKMTSTVFNIYHKSFFDKIINWDNTNLDVHNNTIDRYIESHGNLVVVTTNPFLVYHKEEQVSSIWHFQNTQYLDMFESTSKLLEGKINEFKNK